MLAEVAKPVALVFCILSLYAVFDAAFLGLSVSMQQRICDGLACLVLAAVISVISGLIFRDATPASSVSGSRLWATLPVQMFCWASGVMLVLFALSWYLETYSVFYRDVRF
jgi:hypothetical protein